MSKGTVALAMSGGVDSSVSAYILKERGYDVIGIYMDLWRDEREEYCNKSAAEDARRVAEKLDIPFHVINIGKEFKANVIDYFIDEYLSGRTPNPCVACNKTIKFEAFFNAAKEFGADFMATGHYCKIEERNRRKVIVKAEDDKKDQTYMMYNLKQYQLERTIMPCGEYRKEHIREIAENIGLDVYNKKDSQEICFIPDNDHGGFIKRNYKSKVSEGNFVDKAGKIIGKHKGIIYYTIGQRKGLGIALGKPAYVIDINPITNEVVIGDEEDIFHTELIAKDVNFIPFDKLEKSMELEAKVRYSAKPSKATIIPLGNNKVKVVFKNKQRAITKGQSVVFYDKDMLVGGGIIEEIV
ncbi:tRNA 2-thiouridine(34) synthase MnmA [Clostridium botulinum]|uniref:tRNA-specific 2-thiouridylase MnmA n=2 Tax=Clostridium botulinum TaxID=1491 RepID=A0A846I9L6_CLOBO|nr:tRNA 2-thiouridine(34) synthase MnmA [Clostridium botulinum]AJD27607.1 tRNA (5-methylaminomethyl-2-thiouridylate)-methyltransferase [Clostridium botulinum CDC_297]EPS46128.1 tRNA-specific 2-thiouridylase MnmA [Clostridium botulinum A1 str. CFSAN002368]ACQ55204.1 tRNA (5-methylaminomethyl-2-thiouridylate)-methyltransferase [Clostridium botulinum Ba4 str. 657]AJE10083.1 tRNA (5-methylaminomethyl-2-thiouridylate)-methyltransferase [Clostridium botulinum CDC_1436]APR01914.1 tRNA (5-methylaminom